MHAYGIYICTVHIYNYKTLWTLSHLLATCIEPRMEAETESFREAGNLNILAGFETPQLLLILNSHLICQGSLTGNDWIRTSQVTYAHTTGRRSFHVESPGPDSDISCRRLCGQQRRVRLSSCCRLDRIWEESRCFHGPRESRMLVFQSTSPPPPSSEGSDESFRTIWCQHCLCSVYMGKLTETVWLFTVLRHGTSLGSEPAFINHGFEMLFDQTWLSVPWELAQISQVLLGCPQTPTQLIIS